MLWESIMEAGHIAAFIAQLAAIVLALRLIPITGSRKAWLLVSSAIIVMGFQRLATLLGWYDLPPIQLLSPMVSLLLLAGIACIAPMFRSTKRSEEALRESDERHRALVNASSQVLYRMSPDWSEMRQLQGGSFISDTDKPNRNWLEEYIHPDDRKRVLEAIGKAVQTGTVFELEHRVRRQDGTLGWTFSRAVPVRNASGGIVEWFGAASDITERKGMEEELRESRDELELRVEERTAELMRANQVLQEEAFQRKQAQGELRRKTQLLTAILDSLPVGVWITDNMGKIIESNPAARGIWGGAEYVGIEDYGEYKGWWVETGERIEPHEWALARAFEKGEVSLNEIIEIESFDGKRKIIINSALPIRDENGISAAIVVNQDITELKRAEKTLQEKSRLLEAFFRHTLTPLAFLDRDFDFIRVNEAYAKSCEKKVEDFPGHNHFELYPHAENQAIFEEVVRTGKPYQALAKPFSYPDHPEWGITYWDWTLTPILDDSEKIDFMVFSLKDVTGRKRAEEERKIYMKKLEESNRALQEFASIASHDMQEPLRKVKAFGCRLADQCGPTLGDEGKNYLYRMLNAAERMQNLLDALLNYSRVSSRTEPFREVDLKHLVKEVLSDLEVRIEQTGGQIELQDLPVVKADPNQMRQLFQNLIGNGLKYHGEEEPHISIYGEALNDSFQIHVEDNGIGFDERYLDRIFQPFQRLHGRSSRYEGTGMGLAICKKIVERHGGSITAKSEPGKGSEFIITLPLLRR